MSALPSLTWGLNVRLTAGLACCKLRSSVVRDCERARVFSVKTMLTQCRAYGTMTEVTAVLVVQYLPTARAYGPKIMVGSK